MEAAIRRFIDRLSPARCRWLLAIVLTAGFLARVAYLTIDPPIELSGDEAHYWDWSRQLGMSYYSKGPAVAVVIRFGTTLFGDTMFGVRFPALLLAVGTSLCTYWITRRIFASERLALGAVSLCHAVPMFIAGSMLMTIDPPYYFCWALGTCLAHVAIFDHKKWAWPLAGLAIGGAFLAKYAALLWLISLLLYLILSKRDRRWLATPWPWVTVVVAFACTAPVVIWNVQHDWVTFGHVARSTTENQSHFSPLAIVGNFGEMVGSQIGILNPIIAAFMIGGVWRAVRWRSERHFAGANPPLNTGEGTEGGAADLHSTPPPADLPRVRGRNQIGPRRAVGLLYLLCFGLPFMAIVAIVTIFKEIEPNWPAPAYFTLVPLAAWFVAIAWPKTKGWLIAVILMALVIVPLMHYTTVLYPLINATPRKYDPAFRLHGWTEIGIRVWQEAKMLQSETGTPPFYLCDKYQTAGLMAFYVHGHPKTFYFGSYVADPKERDRLSQYDLWPDRALDQPSLVGRDAVFVGHEQPDLFTAFDRVERLRDVPVIRNGVRIREQKLFKCYGFHGMNRPSDGKTKR